MVSPADSRNQSLAPQKQIRMPAWKLHDYIFENQKEFQTLRNVSDVDSKLKPLFDEFGLDSGELSSCMDSDKALEAVRAQAKAGADAKIQGTPTIFVNGRRLPRAQLLPVLNEAFSRAMN
jgi:protein-disulfide isomerase